jgi:DNA-3-methyladenine glycosylase II
VAVRRTEIDVRGPFSLGAAAGFGFGPSEGRPAPFAGTMRLAFAVDAPAGASGYAGVALRQAVEDGPLEATIELDGAEVEPGAVERQVARILSLDHDGNGFRAAGERDPVLGRLQQAHPGQRPVLFHSPYEAAAWSVISARRRASQAAPVRQAIARELGRMFTVDGETVAAFPGPDRLLALAPGAGLTAEKVERLHAIARAALEGDLGAERLRGLGSERAYEDVQRLPGIGPFYAGLIVLRAAGFTDAMLERPEPRGLAHIRHYYRLEASAGQSEVMALAERWRPFRTWALVLIRLAGDRGTPL